MLTTNNEEKRNKIWRMATLVSTVLIVILVFYFLMKMFTGNPLAGEWQHEDSDLVLIVEDNGKVFIRWTESMDESNAQAVMKYSLDKELKTFTLTSDEVSLQNVLEQIQDEAEQDMIRTNISALSATFEYSVENHQLILTEREYGEQLVFDRR